MLLSLHVKRERKDNPVCESVCTVAMVSSWRDQSAAATWDGSGAATGKAAAAAAGTAAGAGGGRVCG